MELKPLERLSAAAEVFDNCKAARCKLAGKELTVALFEELNGTDRGVENLLGRPIDIYGADVNTVRAIKNEIFEALMTAETEAGAEVRAAVECMCAELVRYCQNYDANSDSRTILKTTLVNKLKELDDTARTSLLHTKINGVIYQCSQAFEFCGIIDKYVEFLDSETCNLGRITEISRLNAGEMSDSDKEFLKELKDACNENNRNGKLYGLWRFTEDAFSDVALADAGYDVDKVIDLVNRLYKADEKYFKLIRKFREALCKDCDTTESLSVKNSEFWSAVDCLFCATYSIHGVRCDLWDMLHLISKTAGIVAPSPIATPDDDDKSDSSTGDNGDNTGDNAGNNDNPDNQGSGTDS